MRRLLITILGLLILVTGSPGYSQITKNPEALAAYQRGQQAGMQGRHEEALRHFEEAIRHDPSFAEGHRLAGFALVSLGEADEAIKHFERAVRLQPRFAAAWLNLAVALGRIGRPEEGLEAYRRAAEIDPGAAQRQIQIELGLRQYIDTFLPIQDRARPHDLDGFSVLPPAGERWRVKGGATRSKVNYDRATGRGEYHTVIAFAQSVKWWGAAKTPNEILNEAAEQHTREFKAPRFSDLRVEVKTVGKYGLSCRRIWFVAQDRGVPYALGEVFVISGWDLFCLHSQSPPAIVLTLAHSQRYLQRWKPLLLETELESFLEGLRVTPVSP